MTFPGRAPGCLGERAPHIHSLPAHCTAAETMAPNGRTCAAAGPPNAASGTSDLRGPRSDQSGPPNAAAGRSDPSARPSAPAGSRCPSLPRPRHPTLVVGPCPVERTHSRAQTAPKTARCRTTSAVPTPCSTLVHPASVARPTSVARPRSATHPTGHRLPRHRPGSRVRTNPHHGHLCRHRAEHRTDHRHCRYPTIRAPASSAPTARRRA